MGNNFTESIYANFIENNPFLGMQAEESGAKEKEMVEFEFATPDRDDKEDENT